MPEIVVSDTGPILHLNEIGRISELRQFQKVVISNLVQVELRQCKILSTVEKELSGILEIKTLKPGEISSQQTNYPQFLLHRADLSVAALASRLSPALVLTDDLQLRKALESGGIKVVGSIGLLFRAFNDGRMSKSELRTALGSLFDDSSLYLSGSMKRYVVARLDELTD